MAMWLEQDTLHFNFVGDLGDTIYRAVIPRQA